jgi:multidrug efflux pump subunit AcrB
MLLTPLLCHFFIRKGLHQAENGQKKRRSPLELMQLGYNRVIVIAMRMKLVALAAGVVAVIAGVMVLQHIPQRFFPFAERDQFVVDVWLPEGWKVEATDAAVRRIETVLQHEKEVVNYTSFIGSSAPRFYYNVNPQLPDKNYAQLLVATISSEATPRLVEELRPKLAQVAPEARVFLRELQQGPVQEAAIEIRLTGDDDKVLRYWGNQTSTLLERTPGALDVHSDWREDAYRLKVNLREEVANRLGFTNANIGQELAGGFEGARVTTYWEGDRDVAVALRLAPALRQSFQDVSNTYLISRDRRTRAAGQHRVRFRGLGPGPNRAPEWCAHVDDPLPGRRERSCRVRCWSASKRKRTRCRFLPGIAYGTEANTKPKHTFPEMSERAAG